LKKQCKKDACAKKTSIGGQALIEGIMMRGPKKRQLKCLGPWINPVQHITKNIL
jgi:hypothetical protein